MDEDSKKMLAELREGQEKIKAGQDRIMFVLIGDELDVNAPPGLIYLVRKHEGTLYGRETPKETGVVEKVEGLMEGKTKLIAACAAITVVGGILAWLIPLLPKFIGH